MGPPLPLNAVRCIRTTSPLIEDGEQRWQTLGQVGGVTVLLVAHTFTEEGPDDAPVEVIHIISARRATRKERMRYEQG